MLGTSRILSLDSVEVWVGPLDRLGSVQKCPDDMSACATLLSLDTVLTKDLR